jgi:hypothetical protein
LQLRAVAPVEVEVEVAEIMVAEVVPADLLQVQNILTPALLFYI